MLLMMSTTCQGSEIYSTHQQNLPILVHHTVRNLLLSNLVQLRDLERILALLESGALKGIEAAASAVERIVPLSGTRDGASGTGQEEPKPDEAHIIDMVLRAAALMDPSETSDTKSAAAVKLLYLLPHSEETVWPLNLTSGPESHPKPMT